LYLSTLFCTFTTHKLIEFITIKKGVNSVTRIQFKIYNTDFQYDKENCKDPLSPPVEKQIELKPFKSYDLEGFCFYTPSKIFINGDQHENLGSGAKVGD
jgi:hypothetical protein